MEQEKETISKTIDVWNSKNYQEERNSSLVNTAADY